MAIDEGQLVDLILPATPRAPGEARRALELLATPVVPQLLADACLLTSELVTNSVRHGTAGPASRLRFKAKAETGKIRVEVSDWGSGFDADRPRPHPRGAVGGFGLYLVDRLASRWGVDRQGPVRVWFELEDSSAEAQR